MIPFEKWVETMDFPYHMNNLYSRARDQALDGENDDGPSVFPYWDTKHHVWEKTVFKHMKKLAMIKQKYRQEMIKRHRYYMRKKHERCRINFFILKNKPYLKKTHLVGNKTGRKKTGVPPKKQGSKKTYLGS